MSLAMIKVELPDNVLACRTCLATDRKLHNINNDRVSEAYKILIGMDVLQHDSLPQYICTYCWVLLNKFYTFRQNCLQVKSYLEKARTTSKMITQNYLNEFPSYIRYTKTEIAVFNSNETTYEQEQENIYNDNEETDNDVDDDIINFPPPENNTINSVQTDTVKIEIVDIHETENNDYQLKTDTKPPELIKKARILPIHKKDSKKGSKLRRRTSKREPEKPVKKLINRKKPEFISIGKHFETSENMKNFESTYDVEITVLSEEQQKQVILDRKLSENYMHSPYKCELCFKGYMCEDILNKHVLSHHHASRGDVICEFCKFRYKDTRRLNQHLKRHRLKFSCKLCSFVSRNTFNAKEHFKIHGGQIHKCEHCGKSYENLCSHLSHMRVHHPTGFIWCEICGEAFIGQYGLNAHKKIAHRHLSLPYTCSCSKQFTSDVALGRHSLGDCVHSSCVHCGESFTERMELREHLLSQHGNRKVIACEKCDRTFNRESDYSVHYRRAHVDSALIKKKEKPWVCEVCGKTSSSKSVLRYHQRTHTGEKPYQCAQCPKGFTLRSLLQSHLKVHSTERPFACRLCAKTFKRLPALRNHENTHNNDPEVSKKRRSLE